MTDEEKRKEIHRLYQQLDKCGQMIAEDDEWGATRRELNREYRRIIKALARLEPDKWRDLPMMRKPSEKYDTLVADFCRDHKCPECKGSGDVTWEYRDRHYNTHRMEKTCPVCDGSGTVDDYTVIKYQFIVCGKALGNHAVKTLLAAMSWLGIDTIRLVNADAQPMLFKPENMDVEILLMPQIRDDKLDAVKVI